MNKAVLYVRVSTEEQARGGVSLAAQEERLIAYCAMAGLEVVEVIREEGVSAAKALATRPGGGRLLGLIRKGQCGHVVALFHLFMKRNAEDALHQTKAWDKAGVALHLVDMGGQTLNTATAMGRFFLNMMAGFAELERNLISERTGAALAHKKRHRQAYSPTPFGFDRVDDALIANESEREILGRIATLRKSGWSFAKIAEALNRWGVPTKKGGKWYASTVWYLLQNDLYKEVA